MYANSNLLVKGLTETYHISTLSLRTNQCLGLRSATNKGVLDGAKEDVTVEMSIPQGDRRSFFGFNLVR